MKTSYENLGLTLTVDNITIDILNLISERFTQTIPSHSHGNNCWEIHYIPYGYGKLISNGKSYDITPNTLFVTGPHVEHAQFPDADNPMVEYCIYLRMPKLPSQKKLSPIIHAFLNKDFWFGEDSHDINSTMKQVFNELEHKYIGYITHAELLLSTILIKLVRNYEQVLISNENINVIGVTDNKSRIIEEYFLYEYDSLSLTTLSERLSLSPRQTERLLKEYYNKSFQEKKAEAKMSAAAILLGDKTKSISTISEILGYSSPEHFSTSFRKYYGVSPRKFRDAPDIH
ncbi:MAG: AraC family transcriptional regulator [Lachnospiraceae bacterium]|nr:AraC family transcriptional regulator [Lachnospiraceae bacterium]